jgi:antitoxin component of RelBE/YafQ-DinJ toxin-antitoxin module
MARLKQDAGVSRRRMTFRLDDDVRDALAAVARRKGVTLARCIATLIQEAAREDK